MRTLMVLLRNVVLICVLLLVNQAVAKETTYSDAENERFMQFTGRFVPATMDEYWYCITGLEQLLKDYPNTYLKSDISMLLLRYYSHVTDDPVLLIALAENMIALKGEDLGAYGVAADVLIEKGVRSEKTLLFAKKALADAQEKYKKWGDYQASVLRTQTGLARAYQLVGQHDKAVSEIQKVIQHWQDFDDPKRSQASTMSSLDWTRMHLLKFYVEEKAWHKAYALATDLLQNAVVRREEVMTLWNQAYVGRFGSAKGMSDVYVRLNAEWEAQVGKRVEGERISKPAPMFAVETLEGKTIRLSDLKGKPVVVTFWAGWCSPCIEELPLLSQLKARFEGVEFLAINIDKEVNTRRDMVVSNRSLRARNLTFVLGDLETRKAFGSQEIPYTCVIDGDGNIRYERRGLSADFSAAMATQLKWVLSEGEKQ